MEPQNQDLHITEAANAKFEAAVQGYIKRNLKSTRWAYRVQHEAQLRMNAILAEEQDTPYFTPPTDDTFEEEVQKCVEKNLEKTRYHYRLNGEVTQRIRILLESGVTDEEKEYRMSLRKESQDRRIANEVEHRLRFLKKEQLEDSLATEEKIHQIVVEILKGRNA